MRGRGRPTRTSHGGALRCTCPDPTGAEPPRGQQPPAGGESHADHRIFTLPERHSGAFATGPGGRRLLVGGDANGFYVYDPGALTAGKNHPNQLAKVNAFATRNVLAADLDGDGVDEVIGLTLDVVGHDQNATLSGARYRLADEGLHGLVVSKLTSS
ncbi:hypothetical protein [Streptomyces sp. NPDC001876]|uniref:hypothetical protein n=1 Tax=Streptomyces sp. NPDC001876 TaxID=3154402 RepID=UPI0033178540